MDMIEELKQQYGWNKAVAVDEQTIETDHGLKRLRRWQDQELMNWHINWRDRCNAAPLVLTDRMIRTQDGEAFVPWKSAWITIHDDIPTPFLQEENGQVWGTLIGKMIQSGLRQDRSIQTQQAHEPDLISLEKKQWMFPLEIQPTIRNIVFEGKARLNKARAIQKGHAEHSLPILDPIHGLEQAKDIHGMLHWQGSEEYPEIGYYSISTFIKQWLKRYKSDELSSLLHHIESVNPGFAENQGALLLAECLIPYEIQELLDKNLAQSSNEEVERALENCKEDWKISKQAVDEIAAWLDGRRVK